MRRLNWIAVIVLSSVLVAGCAMKRGEKAGAAKKPAAAKKGPLEARKAEIALEKSKRDYLVASFLKSGDDARERGDWAGALTFYRKVLDIDPGNQTARTRIDEAGAILGTRGGTIRDALSAAASERQVRRQQAQADITDLVTVAGRLEKEGDYEGARKRYEKALMIAELYPYYGDFTPNREQLRSLIARAAAKKVEADKARREAELREAAAIKEAEERKMREEKEAKIAALFRDANLAMERNNFELARAFAEEILRQDPTNRTAAELSKLAAEAHLAADELNTRRNIREQWRRAFEAVTEAANPQVQDVVFPKEWLELQANRKPPQFGRALAAGMDERSRQIQNILATTRVTVDFDETSLRDAAKFLAGVAGVNILVLPSVDDALSEDEQLVTLQAENITVEDALKLITSIKSLSFRIEKGVVQIGTTEEGRGAPVLDIYDVKDLTVPIRPFPGKDINLVPSGGAGGFGFGEEEEQEPQPVFAGDDLASLIQEMIDLGDEGEVNFQEGGRLLVVKAPPDAHQRIRELLDGLRATGGLTVSLETRFITVEDSFLQDIGVDVRGLGDQSGGLGVRGKGRRETFDDVLSGTQGAPAGIGTSSLTGVFYNLNSDGDVRGRVENLLDVALGRSDLLTASGGASIQATYLDDTQAEMILRAVEKSSRSTLVVAPKITVYNHERANVTVLNQVSYIQDFDVEIAQASQIGDPIVQTLRDGVILDVTPIVSSDRKYVTLELRPTVAILRRPIATFSTTLANGPPVIIQLPEIRIQRVRTTVTMPDGGILLLGGLKFFQEERLDSSVPWLNKVPILSFFWSRKGTFVSRRNLIILLKAKILALEEMEPRRYGAR